jgi:hypothetical protein
MSNPIAAAFKDSLELIPFLLVIYIGIAWLEYRFGNSIQTHIRKAGNAGPLLGALFGCLPQCGFSVVGSALYTRGFITTGTLLAVFISTSDEAVPVIMAVPSRIGIVIPLILTKVGLALLAGYAVDAVLRKRPTEDLGDVVTEVPAFMDDIVHQHSTDDTHEHVSPDDTLIEVNACCGHHLPTVNRATTLLLHPIIHTAQVFLVLFVVSIGINLLVGREGTHLKTLLGYGSIWQPVVSSLVGLIPNCGASVALTEIYLKGGMTFGAVIAGLSSSAGLGMLILIKENRSIPDTMRILALLVGISIAAGIIIQMIEPYISILLLR